MRSMLRPVLPFLAVVTLSAGGPGPAIPAKPDDAAILHVLNRTGFGARPGDVERVRQMGLANYIEQQLHPERVPDAQMSARLTGLETIDKSSRQLAEDYYVPVQMARQQAKQQA